MIDEQLRNYLIDVATAANSPDPEDAVHDVLVNLLTNGTRPQYPKAYLATAVRNKVYSQHRQIKVRKTSPFSADPKADWTEYSAPVNGHTSEDFLISRLDLASFMNPYHPIPGQGVPELPRNPAKKNSDRKDLETIHGYEQIIKPTPTERVRVHHARRRLQKQFGLQLRNFTTLPI